jgi:hypothetical protein
MVFEADLSNALLDRQNLAFGGVRLHHDNHEGWDSIP